ncbi:hypothetical protein E2C01_014873 [Portunus trituberculatus]|uniref:Uncharacterized protein n=1 Tax=Portunus trituberculatus TaxID=210409 RepID=A0A5B7DLB2_PORTR|nr:hypothetical protein [Portunus trituberculatus]
MIQHNLIPCGALGEGGRLSVCLPHKGEPNKDRTYILSIKYLFLHTACHWSTQRQWAKAEGCVSVATLRKKGCCRSEGLRLGIPATRDSGDSCTCRRIFKQLHANCTIVVLQHNNTSPDVTGKQQWCPLSSQHKSPTTALGVSLCPPSHHYCPTTVLCVSLCPPSHHYCPITVLCVTLPSPPTTALCVTLSSLLYCSELHCYSFTQSSSPPSALVYEFRPAALGLLLSLCLWATQHSVGQGRVEQPPHLTKLKYVANIQNISSSTKEQLTTGL